MERLLKEIEEFKRTHETIEFDVGAKGELLFQLLNDEFRIVQVGLSKGKVSVIVEKRCCS